MLNLRGGTNKRSDILKRFKHYVQHRDNRTMDENCTSSGNNFQLQTQQQFLRDYMREYPDWRSLLLYHRLGSGKTCTAITMAEEFIAGKASNKPSKTKRVKKDGIVSGGVKKASLSAKPTIKVILPARLRTNFFDELISPCGFDAYISKADFEKYYASDTKNSEKNKIRKRFMELIESKYEIMSIERFKMNMYKHSHDLKKYIADFTKDSMIIVDEVHNMMSDKYDGKVFQDIMMNGEIKKRGKGMNTILFKVLTSMAHKSCKMVFMTATPIFDNINQFKELVRVMAPEESKGLTNDSKISEVIDILRGKVSFFPGTSANAYPEKEYVYHKIEMSKTQDRLTARLNPKRKEESKGEISDLDDLKWNDEGEEAEEAEEADPEAFMVKRRQISIVGVEEAYAKAMTKAKMEEVIGNMSEFCPKIKEIVNLIENNIGKHLIYTNFVKVGVNLIEQVLISKGWVNFLGSSGSKGSKGNKGYKGNGKVYAIWSGDTKDVDKTLIKNVANSKDNVYGDNIRVIIGSPSIKEGVSFKHIQHLHLLDAVWNISAKDQIEGRAVRFCSHVDITDEALKRKVFIHIYKMIPRIGGKTKLTCDEIIYDRIIPKKERLIRAGESALRKVSIDHYLYRELYSPKVNNAANLNSLNSKNSKSPIDLSEEEDVLMKKQKMKKVGNTCPKPRRPDGKTGECNVGFVKRENVHGDECCYKVRGKGLK